MEELELMISQDGSIRTIYKDTNISLLQDIGEVTVTRASDVEWEVGKGWTVKAHHNSKLAIRKRAAVWVVSDNTQLELVYFPLRADAIEAELKHFWELLPPKKGNE